MCRASRSAKVSFMKSSVEWWKTCKILALWQACLLSGILLLSGTGFAQLSTASLSGAVKDASGAVVPKGKVVLKNVATAVEHSTTTNDAGAYLFLDIIPGRYVLSALAPGFGEQRVPEFTLAVGQAATIDFALAVGSQSEVVTVQGVAPATGHGKCQSRPRCRDETGERSSAERARLHPASYLNPGSIPGEQWAGRSRTR